MIGYFPWGTLRYLAHTEALAVACFENMNGLNLAASTVGLKL